METLEDHKRKVQQIQKRFSDFKSSQAKTGRTSDSFSNVTRKKGYLAKVPSLGLEKLDAIVSIDPENMEAFVEPSVTMDRLVDACLFFGLVPPVVPEFKGITVGGAISGAALESSSHRYGQFSDICKSFEVMLGDGTVVEVSRESNSELFYALSGCFGTLGFILGVRLHLVKASKKVEVTLSTYSTMDSLLQKLTTTKGTPADFVEAIIYSETKGVLIEGRKIENEKKSLPECSFNKPWDDWFYSVVDKMTGVDAKTFIVPMKDYLFRHDRGAFWMGGFGPHPSLLFSFLSGRAPSFPFTPKNPSFPFRLFFGFLNSSKALYRSLHRDKEAWFEKYFVIQDFYIPEENLGLFLSGVNDSVALFPLWICPVKPGRKEALFSPHATDSTKMLFDVGVYGLPRSLDGKSALFFLEALSTKLKGRKMLYAKNLFSFDQFWRIYPKKEYDYLRIKTKFDGVIPGIEEKVL